MPLMHPVDDFDAAIAAGAATFSVRPDLPAGNQAESGNLVAGGGFCLIAGKNRLQAFALPSVQPKPKQENQN